MHTATIVLKLENVHWIHGPKPTGPEQGGPSGTWIPALNSTNSIRSTNQILFK